jgi:hypothetical protein
MKSVIAGVLIALALVLAGFTVVKRLAADEGEAVEPLSADAAYAITGPLTCESEIHDVPALPLEAEPVAMLVCADPESSSPWTAPTDLVEGDLTDLVDALAGLERAPDGDYPCTMQAGPAFDLLLRFSRDRYARIHGDTGTCGVVTVASGEWFGAQGVLDAALALVERQRASSEPPATVEPADLDCNGGQDPGLGRPLSLTGDVADLTRLVSCWQPNADELPPFPPGTEVRPRDVRALAADMAANASEGKRFPALRCPGGLDRHYFQHLYGQTRWGDLVAVYGECRRFSVPLPGGQALWWTPSPASQRILDALRR